MWQFQLKYDDPEITTKIVPHYSELIFKQEKDPDFLFLRKKLTSSIILVGNAYEIVNNSNISDKFIININKKENEIYNLFYSAYFYKSDCRINNDKKKIEVDLGNSIDDYTEFVAGLDKEFNIIDLAPEIKELQLKKRGILQIYIQNSDYVTNYLAGNYWESKVIAPAGFPEITDDYFFTLCKTVVFAKQEDGKTPEGWGSFTEDYSKQYYYTGFSGGEVAELEQTQPGGGNYVWTITVNSVITYRSQGQATPIDINAALMTSETSSDTLTFYAVTPHARLLTDNSSILGHASHLVPESDIVSPVNFKYISSLEFTTAPTIRGSVEHSLAETEWGRIQDIELNGGDYRERYSNVEGFVIPIDRNSWKWYSFWYFPTSQLILANGDSDLLISDNYTLGSCMKKIVKELDDSINFEETNVFSDFLFSTINPITGDANLTNLLTPKTNVLVGEYTSPATKGITTLRTLLNLIVNSMNCLFFIDENKNLRIEHIRYFQHGGSYSQTAIIFADLTTIKAKNNKAYSYFVNEYIYKKEELLEEFNFKWGDKSSLLFEGTPIKSISKFIARGNVSYESLGNFMPDLDFMNSDPSAINNDGFVISGASLISGNSYELPITEFTLNGADYYVQNYFFSNHYLHQKFFLDNANSVQIEINGNVENALSLKKIKLQENVIFPLDSFDLPDIFDLVKTDLGNGTPEDLEYNGVTNSVKTNLRHEFN